MQGSPPSISSLLSPYPHLLSLALDSPSDAAPQFSLDLLPVLKALVQAGDIPVSSGGKTPSAVDRSTTDWNEFWSRPAVAESLSIAIQTPLPPNIAASFLAPHLSFSGTSDLPLRVSVDAKTKRVSIPSIGDDVDNVSRTPKISKDSPSKRSSSNACGDNATPNKIQKVFPEKLELQEVAESSNAAQPPTPRPATPRAVAPAATPRSFPSTVSPTPLTIKQLNIYCGVTVPSGWCLHAVDSCRLHNEKTRRSVLGRGCDFDSILARCAARRSFHDFTMTEMWKSGGMCTVPYPHSTYPPIVGGSRVSSGVDGDDLKNSTLENRFAFFGGKKCDDFVLDTVGGLKPKYNFKAPFDRYEPPSVRNTMSDLFRVSSDPLFLPLRRPCVPIVKPAAPPVATPQTGTPGSTPRASSSKGATGMQGSSSFPPPQSPHPAASPRAPSSLPPSASNALPASLSTTSQSQQQRPSSSKSSKTPASQSSGNHNSGSTSTQSSKFVGTAAAPGAAAGTSSASFGKSASSASGIGTSGAAYMTGSATSGSSLATSSIAHPQSAKSATFSPSTMAQGTSHSTLGSAGALNSATISATSSTVAAAKTTFNSADASRAGGSTPQSANSTGTGGNASKSTKNNAGAQAVAGPVYEVPLHLVQSSQKPVPGMRYRNITVQYLRECDINKILPTSFRRYCVIQLAHLQEITTAFIISKNGYELELAKDTDPPPCSQHSWFALQYNNAPCIIETQITTSTGTRFLVYADLRCLNCHQVSFLYDKATNDRARADQSKQAAAQAAAAAASASGSGTPSSASKAANRRTAAKNAKGSAGAAASPASAAGNNAAVATSTTAATAGAGAASAAGTASATMSAVATTAASAPQPTQTGPTASAPKSSKSRSKVQIDYSSEPSATYLAQLQAASSSAASTASPVGSTTKSKSAAGYHPLLLPTRSCTCIS
jgi:hypothetical protein